MRDVFSKSNIVKAPGFRCSVDASHIGALAVHRRRCRKGDRSSAASLTSGRARIAHQMRKARHALFSPHPVQLLLSVNVSS
jgi:hypothetical protein